ncbi:MAG: hypothetical protein ACKVJE_17240 [Pseudomonadales bacterium]
MNTDHLNELGSVSSDWYEALNQMCEPFTSDQIALWLVDAGLTKSGTSPKSVAAHVRAARNADKADYFKQSELIVLMERSGSLAPVNFVLEQLGCIQATRRAENPDNLILLSNKHRSLKSELVMVERKLSEVGATYPPAKKDMPLFCQS